MTYSIKLTERYVMISDLWQYFYIPYQRQYIENFESRLRPQVDDVRF